MGVLSGLTIVFTGKMSRVRAEMEREAAGLGAATEPRVTRRTDWLVTGERVGKKKTRDAERFGCRVITEKEYRMNVQARERDRLFLDEEADQEEEQSRPAAIAHPEWAKKLRNPKSIRF